MRCEVCGACAPVVRGEGAHLRRRPLGVRYPSAWLLAGQAVAVLALGLAELVGSQVDGGQPWTRLVLSFRTSRAWYGVSPPDPGRAEHDG